MRSNIPPHEPGEPTVYSVEEENEALAEVDKVFIEIEASQARWDKQDALKFTEIHNKYEPMVRSTIAFHLAPMRGDPIETTNDLTQETFIRAWRARYTYKHKGEDGLKSWLRRIATNATIDLFRRNRWEELILDAPIGDDADGGKTMRDLIPDAAPDPMQQVLADELPLVVRQCVARLEPKERIALFMRHVEGRTLQEIAEELLDDHSSGRHMTATRFIKPVEAKFQRYYKEV